MFSLKPQFTRVLDVPFNPHEGFHVIAFETVTWLTAWSICDSVQEEGGESKTKDWNALGSEPEASESKSKEEKEIVVTFEEAQTQEAPR